MSAAHLVDRDERTVAVEHASYRWAYLLLSYALLVDVACRSFLYGESAWDLLGLVVAGGAVTAAYQARHRVLTRGWVWTVLLVVVVAAVVAAAIAIVGRVF
jgi:hypothetical protein